MFRVEPRLGSASISRTIRFTEKLFDELQKMAYENDVSFNSLILQCCQYALEESEEKKIENEETKRG